jgi:uncharacterized GH25 family protein
MRKWVLLAIAICCTAGLTAHEFWLMPARFFYFIREKSNIRFQAGENFIGSNWSGNRDKIQQLNHYTPGGLTVDISDKLSMQPGDSLLLPLAEEGTHMIVFNSKNTFIDLAPDQFDAYLEEDGLSDALKYRRDQGETTKNGREYYQRSVKTIVQVGNKRTDQCLLPTSLPLDIVPLENPYSSPDWPPGRSLPEVGFQLLFLGEPLANTLVKVWYRDESGTNRMEALTSNKKGRIKMARHPGPVMISAVYMRRLKDDPQADWQSYWASLTLEFSRFFPVNR